ncbi:Mis12-Mtw1 protein family-domain-containing protein [Ephemerocybe angulata]|uniref:Mis12-Mtw1 protein family-domain-containing protein n=1 Tax=Ephemerocybe angulata TaxID=980116 RepID=A0A8H6MH68_9AGAR|nr:Mis12-Mtw1 protein family-domain-containing protein [Tulosesus angulatus]
MLVAVKSQHQPFDTSKRKRDMDTSMNPLMAAAAAKRAKKDKANANKRKQLPTDDAPGGLLIVRPSPTQPSHPPPQPLFNPNPKPPSKKFRADPSNSTSSTSNSNSTSNPNPNNSNPNPAFNFPKSTSNQIPPLPLRKPSTSRRLLEEEDVSHSDVERDARAREMEDEADRAPSPAPAVITTFTTIMVMVEAVEVEAVGSGGANGNGMFNFPPPSGTSKSTSSKGKPKGGRARSRGRETDAMDVDTRVPVPQEETPQQTRNKRLREGAMAAIASDHEDVGGGEEDGRGRDRGRTSAGGGSGGAGRGRRASSLGRGKRISTSFEMTGVITQPHNSVSEQSFYKHIDADLPDVERVRQLLIWCSLRAVNTYNKPPLPPSSNPPVSGPLASGSTSSSSIPGPSGNGKDPSASKETLPPLSAKAAAALKRAQDEFVRMVAEKRVDLASRGRGREKGRGEGEDGAEVRENVRENVQNVSNRNWEGRYTADIQRAQAEEEAWKKVSYEYDAYAKRLQASLEKRRRALEALKASRLPSPAKPKLASKGKGKARDTEDDQDADAMDEGQDAGEEDEEEKRAEEARVKEREAWLPQPHELAPVFQKGAELARSILLRKRPPSAPLPPVPVPASAPASLPPVPAPATPTATPSKRKPRRSSMALIPLPRLSLSAPASASASTTEGGVDLEETLRAALPSVQFKLDLLHAYLNAARATTGVCERVLDERYRVLNRVLDGRMGAGGDAEFQSPPCDRGRGRGRGGERGWGRRGRKVACEVYCALRVGCEGWVCAAKGLGQEAGVAREGGWGWERGPHALLRALTRVDAARPPALVGDAARRAAREVGRAGGEGGGSRRVTVLPGMLGGASSGGVLGTGGGNGGTGGAVPQTPRKGVPGFVGMCLNYELESSCAGGVETGGLAGERAPVLCRGMFKSFGIPNLIQALLGDLAFWALDHFVVHQHHCRHEVGPLHHCIGGIHAFHLREDVSDPEGTVCILEVPSESKAVFGLRFKRGIRVPPKCLLLPFDRDTASDVEPKFALPTENLAITGVLAVGVIGLAAARLSLSARPSAHNASEDRRYHGDIMSTSSPSPIASTAAVTLVPSASIRS